MVGRVLGLLIFIILLGCNAEQPSYKSNPPVFEEQIVWKENNFGDSVIYESELIIDEKPWVVLTKRNTGFKLFLNNKQVAERDLNFLKTNDYYQQAVIGIYSQWEKNHTWIDDVAPGTYQLKIKAWGENISAPIIATRQGKGAKKGLKPDAIFEEASELPVLYINTNNKVIPDEPKVSASISWVNPSQLLMHQTGAINIALERRGNTSQHFAKKAYAINVEQPITNMLGLPSAKKYILYAPYADKSLVRNAVAYTLASKTNTKAVQHIYCELVVNGDYQGVYMLMHRMDDLNNLGVDTSSVVIKIDRGNPTCHYLTKPSTYPKKRKTRYEIISPSFLPEKDVVATANSLQNFEKSIDHYDLSSDEFLKYIDIASFVDYFIINEWSKNIDAYRLSSYFNFNAQSKKWQAGPVWDYNFAFGLVDYENGFSKEGFVYDLYDEIPFWWEKLAFNQVFQKAVINRWKELRKGLLSDENVYELVNSLINDKPAIERNFIRWKLLGQKEVWPNYFIGKTHQDELNYLCNWIKERSNWLDQHWFDKENEILAQVEQQKETILQDEAWKKDIKQKAEANQIAFEMQLENDAWWMIYNRFLAK